MTYGVLRRRKATAEYEVVPGSGTDELAGLSGTGGFSAGHAEEHDLTLDSEVKVVPVRRLIPGMPTPSKCCPSPRWHSWHLRGTGNRVSLKGSEPPGGTSFGE